MATSVLKLRAGKHSLLYKRVPEQPSYILNDCLLVTQKTILNHASSYSRKPATQGVSEKYSYHNKDTRHELKDTNYSYVSPHHYHTILTKQKRLTKPNIDRTMTRAHDSSTVQSEKFDVNHPNNRFPCPMLNVKIKKKIEESGENTNRHTARSNLMITRSRALPCDTRSTDASSVQIKNEDLTEACPKSYNIKEASVQTRKSLEKPKSIEEHSNDPIMVSVTKRNKVTDDTNTNISKECDNSRSMTRDYASSAVRNIGSSIWKQDESFDKTDDIKDIPAPQSKIHKGRREIKRSKTSTGYYQDAQESLPVRATKSARPRRCATAPLQQDTPTLTTSACRAKCLQLEEYLYNDNLPKFQEALLPFSTEDKKMLVDFKETRSSANIFFRSCGLAKVPFAKFLLGHCNPDLELSGPFFLLDDHTQYMVTPLWQAAASGCLPLVKMLKEHGADINATSDTGSSALLVACYMARIDVATYLVCNKAVVNSSNSKGLTCLMNAVHNVDLVRLLVLNGAEINRTDHRGNTSLHFAVEEGGVKTVKILIELGGNPSIVNKDGFSAIHAAAKYRHRDVLEYLLQVSSLKVKDIIDVYEMIGAMIIMMDDDLDEGFSYLHKATTLRHLNKSQVIMKKSSPSLLSGQDNEAEFVTLQQLNKIAKCPNRLRIQSLMIYERQWGSAHKNFLQLLLYCGATFADHLNFRQAADLWRVAYQMHFDKHVISSDTNDPFNHNVLKSLGFLIKLLFQWRKVLVSRRQLEDNYCDTLENKIVNPTDINYRISEMNVRQVLSLLCQHCVAAHKLLGTKTDATCYKYKEAFRFLLRSAICVLLVYVESFSRHERCESVWQYVRDLISLHPRGEKNETLLHMCVCPQTLNKLDLDISGTEINWPSASVINIALILGANPTDSNNEGNTALHFAATLQRRGVVLEGDGIIQSLLSKGAHADQVNNLGETAYNLLGRQDPDTYNNNKNTWWQKAISLKCLSARVVVAHDIEYIGEIPTSLYSFVELHRSVHVHKHS